MRGKPARLGRLCAISARSARLGLRRRGFELGAGHRDDEALAVAAEAGQRQPARAVPVATTAPVASTDRSCRPCRRPGRGPGRRRGDRRRVAAVVTGLAAGRAGAAGRLGLGRRPGRWCRPARRPPRRLGSGCRGRAGGRRPALGGHFARVPVSALAARPGRSPGAVGGRRRLPGRASSVACWRSAVAAAGGGGARRGRWVDWTRSPSAAAARRRARPAARSRRRRRESLS